jgi:hypothetical protein
MRILLLLILTVTFSCKEKSDTNAAASTAFAKDTTTVVKDTMRTTLPQQTPGTLNWASSFRAFRDAVYNHDKVRASEFATFPIMNAGNEIWYLAYQGNEQLIAALPTTIKPFIEKDFDKYFDRVFPKAFITALNKINVDELYKNGSDETKDLKEKNTTYKIYSTFSKKDRKLTLNLALDTEMKDDNGEVLDGGESNIIYEFDVVDNKSIKLKQVRIAG